MSIEIKYLKTLEAHPSINSKRTSKIFSRESLPDQVVAYLETLYNNGVVFPASLRELLYLAGANCYVLDYGTNDSPLEMQESSRDYLAHSGKTIDRPFYVIDVFNENDQFLFVYLDESEDPVVYEAILYLNSTDNWIHCLAKNMRLSEYIDYNINKLLIGQNPF
jgi:hypothetical protein